MAGDAVALDRGDALVPEVGVADLVGGVAEHQRAQPRRPGGGDVLGDQPADRQPAEDDLGRADVVDQPGEVGGVVGDRVGRLAEVGQPVPALVVASRPKSAARSAGDLVPDAEVGAERIDEDEERPSARSRCSKWSAAPTISMNVTVPPSSSPSADLL